MKYPTFATKLMKRPFSRPLIPMLNHVASYLPFGGLLPLPPPDGLPVVLGPFGGFPPALANKARFDR